MIRLLPLLALLGCSGDETVTAYGGADAVWQLAEIDGVAFTAPAQLQFSDPGRVAGRGPCNTFAADQTAPYPWIAIENIASTRRACADLARETVFFAALGEMTEVEIAPSMMIMRDGAGREMVFRTAADQP